MNTSIKPVVVGVVDKQPTALRFALREAHRRGTELRVVHSAGIPAQAAAFYEGAGMLEDEDLRASGQQVIDDAKHFIGQEVCPVTVDYVLTMAPPIVALQAEAATASTLVVGADDLSWPERLLGGAVTSYLAGHAACPVVVVPERAYPTPLSGGVVVTLDGDTSATGPLQFAFEQAQVHGNLLHVLHATPPATVMEDAEAARAVISEVLAGWSDKFPDIRVLLNFPIDYAAEACVRATEHSELVVVGRPHNSSLPIALMRPLATQVLRHAHAPVAVVPVDYRGA